MCQSELDSAYQFVIMLLPFGALLLIIAAGFLPEEKDDE